MAAPFVYLPSTFHGNSPDALLKAALDGNLGRIKGIIRNLGIGNGDRAAVLTFHKDGFGVLHCAACQGHLEVCKYLVEELGCDPNMAEGSCEGVTPFMASAQSGDISTVKYLLDHGGDLMKADAKGRTVLHHAVCAGSCKVTEFLLSKGIPVDIDCGRGTPLFHAANNEQDQTLKILLDHHANPNTIVGGGMGTPLMSALIYRSLKCMKLLIKAGADVNGEGSVMPPLVFATGHGGYTNFIQLLLEAGANPNIPDDLGRLPIELAALRECKEEVEMLLPLTSPIPNVRNWSVDGVISHAKFENTKPLPNSPFTIPLNHFAALQIRKRLRRLHLRRIPSPMDPAASGRFDRLQSSFKISVQCLLTACSREVVNEAFSSFMDAEKARLHRMLALVLKSMQANIMVAAALDKIDDFVEEQNLDALASEKTTVEEIQEKVSRAKKDEIEYLTGLLKKIEESSEARQKFSNAKSISSSQFFGDQASFEKDAQVSLQKFSGSSAISSADLFGHPANNPSVDLSASDLINRISFQAAQDLSSLKNMAGETGKKLTSMASNIITDLQDRIL